METKELIAAFIKAQGEIEGALKDKLNPHFKSKYADLSAVVDAIKPALQKHGLGFIQVSHDAEHCACIETLIVHSSGQTMSAGKVSVPVSKIDAQGYGSAMTYARRYSLSAAFGVCPEDDDGNAATKAKPESAKSVHQSELEKLSDDRKKVVADLSVEIIDTFRDTGDEEAFDLYEQAKESLFDEQEKIALWGQFASDIRRKLKEIGTKRKENSNVV